MRRIIKDIWYALTSPESYRDFMNYKKRNLLLHVLVLVVTASIVIFGIPAAKIMAKGGFTVMLEENVPDFRANSEEGFWIEEAIEIDEFNFLIKADSSEVKEDITDLNGQYGSYDYVIMVDKEQIHLNVPGIQEITTRFDEIKGFSFTTEDLLQYIPVVYMA